MKKATQILSIVTLLMLALYVRATDIPVTPGLNNITNALIGAADGDVLLLARGGAYFEQADVKVNKKITIKADPATSGALPIVARISDDLGALDNPIIFDVAATSFIAENINFHGGKQPGKNSKYGLQFTSPNTWVELTG
jgi:hypothetical protein